MKMAIGQLPLSADLVTGVTTDRDDRTAQRRPTASSMFSRELRQGSGL
jgi:hypothetical protein